MFDTLSCPTHPNTRLRFAGPNEEPRCGDCGRAFPIHDGIINLVEPDGIHGTFEETESQQWDQHSDRYDESRVADASYMAGLDAAIEALNVQPGNVVLDAGCGTGLSVRRYFRADVQVIGLDLSMASLRYQRRARVPRVPLARGSLKELPFPDATFDKVLCANALQHLPTEEDRRCCIRELARVARPSARIVISAHNYSIAKQNAGYLKEGSAGSRSGSIQYIYRFTPSELQRLLETEMKVERLTGAGFPLPYRFKLSPLSRRLERILWGWPALADRAHMLVAVCRKPNRPGERSREETNREVRTLPIGS